jgi:cytochrome c oxidase subunit 4
MSQPVEHVEPAEEEELSHHPRPRQYVMIAIVLAVITAFEVAIYYVEGVRTILVPALIVFAFLKFSLVVLWFMHLRFDSRLFRRLFVTGLVLAFIVFGIVLATFFLYLGVSPGVEG